MNRFALASFLLSLLVPVAVIAQNPPNPGAPPTLPRLPGQPGQPHPGRPYVQQEGADLLQRNYLILVKVKHGETSTEFSVLTASPTINLRAMGGGRDNPVITFGGNLKEMEGGKLVLQYQVGARIPIITNETPNGQKNYEYSEESSTGSLHLTPGKTYELMKSADRIYSVTISPAEETGH